MTNKEFYLKMLEEEEPITLKVLEAVPGNHLDYRPHTKSRNALELASMFVADPSILLLLLTKGEVKTEKMMKDNPPPENLKEVIGGFKKSMEALKKAVSDLSDEEWENEKAKMMNGGTWEDTKQNLAWGFLTDMIHHRGQLSTYLRPMGGKVPAIYGPSADDKGNM